MLYLISYRREIIKEMENLIDFREKYCFFNLICFLKKNFRIMKEFDLKLCIYVIIIKFYY